MEIVDVGVGVGVGSVWNLIGMLVIIALNFAIVIYRNKDRKGSKTGLSQLNEKIDALEDCQKNIHETFKEIKMEVRGLTLSKQITFYKEIKEISVSEYEKLRKNYTEYIELGGNSNVEFMYDNFVRLKSEGKIKIKKLTK